MKEKEINFEIFGKNTLLILPIIENKTEAGIIKSDAMLQKEESDRDLFFEVALVGKECEYVSNKCKVYIRAMQHPKVLIDDVWYLSVHESNIIGMRNN